jgi:hypothetical protein
MRRLALTISLIVLTAAVATLQGTAQGQTRLSAVQVSIWPEYDKPSALVIYRLGLEPGTPLPAMITLLIPSSVGEPTAVAWTSPDGQLLSATYSIDNQGEWTAVTFESQSLNAQLEYYADLSRDGAQRSFTFTWPGGVEVGDLSFEVQQPLGATPVQITPAPSQQHQGPDGMLYYEGDLGATAASDLAMVTLSYSKSGQGLSIDQMTASQPQSPSAPAAGSTPDIAALLPYVLLGFGVLLIVAGGWWYLRLRGDSAPRRRRVKRRPGSRRGQDSGSPPARTSPVFCHNCGMQAEAGDRYCRSCGIRLRQ